MSFIIKNSRITGRLRRVSLMMPILNRAAYEPQTYLEQRGRKKLSSLISEVCNRQLHHNRAEITGFGKINNKTFYGEIEIVGVTEHVNETIRILEKVAVDYDEIDESIPDNTQLIHLPNGRNGSQTIMGDLYKPTVVKRSRPKEKVDKAIKIVVPD